MKKDKIQDLAKNKPFNKFDFFALLGVLLFILFLFVSFVFFSTHDNSDGFIIQIDDVTVYSFNYSNKKHTINSQYEKFIEVDLENQTVTVYTDLNKNHFNKIKYDVKNKSVKMVESNCSTSKDCVYMPEISDNLGIIYCAPRKIKILPIGGRLNNSPVIG